MRKKKEESVLPEGFRIVDHCLVKGAIDDPYDWGEWTRKLQQWQTWTEGFWHWKHQVSGWVTIEKNWNDSVLVQTAQLIHKGEKMKPELVDTIEITVKVNIQRRHAGRVVRDRRRSHG